MATPAARDHVDVRSVMEYASRGGWLIDDAHRDLTESILHWLMQHGAQDSLLDYAKAASFCSTFAHHCVPAAAGWRLRELASRFLAIIYMTDNASDAELLARHDASRRILDALISAPMSTSMNAPDIAPIRAQMPDPFDVMFAALVRVIAGAGAAALRFARSWLSVCAAVTEERARAGASLTLEELFGIRRETIFADVFVDFLCAAEGLPVVDDEIAAIQELRRLANDHMFLTNDIASLARDMARDSNEPNVVLLYLRDGTASSLEQAIDAVIDLCNRRAGQVELACVQIRAAHAGEVVERLLRMEIATLNGNLDTSKHLCLFRYRDFGLARIRYVRA